MISFWRIFWLETLSFVRSKTVTMLTLASVVWMLAVPFFAKGDGTAEGMKEVYVHYSLGGVFALTLISLLAASTGTIASERAAKRLQLTMVRPVSCMAIATAKICAHLTVGAVVLAVAVVVLCFKVDFAERCNHVLSPVMQSPREEAISMYEQYMADTNTPAEVRSARKSTVIRLLTQKAVDHYQSIPTNRTVSWKFHLGEVEEEKVAVQMRFTTQFDMRMALMGDFELNGRQGAVSNITQAVLTIPLRGKFTEGAGEKGLADLKFVNRGESSLMLRPRRDIHLLVEGDSFFFNLIRAYIELLAILALVVAFGVFLGSALGRPVALFTAMATLVLSEMAPSVIEQYPDQLETSRIDRIGLVLTRFAAEVTHPISMLSPLDSLCKNECIEPREVARVVALDCILIPVALALLAALAMPKKQENE